MATNLDPNTWYQMTETRVGVDSSLQYNGNSIFMAAAQPINFTGQSWQFQPVENGVYEVRNRASTIYMLLSTCLDQTEVDASKTKPCMKDARGDISQQWSITNWGDDTYRFVNVGNGTGYNMDCHPGNPMFMSSTTASVPVQPAQHWQFKALDLINDQAYSTVVVSEQQIRKDGGLIDTRELQRRPQRPPLLPQLQRLQLQESRAGA
jgi:hypothetical protein